MIVLETNVVAEPMKLSGNPAVQAWLDRQVADTLHLTATTLAELMVGIEILPAGKHKDRPAAALAELLVRLFGARILPFDQPAASGRDNERSFRWQMLCRFLARSRPLDVAQDLDRCGRHARTSGSPRTELPSPRQ